MPKLVIKPVETSREKKQFLLLPWQIYRGDPSWVPPLRTNQKELVGYAHHPFYDEAEGQTFLALHDGKPVGRILALVNHAHNRTHNEKRGFFGFFETIDDEAVARGLLDAASGWLRERGMTSVRGPVNPSMNYEIGLLIEGFDQPPTFMMTYNKPYYQRLVEGYGFQKTQDLYAFWGHMDMVQKLDQKLYYIWEECKTRFNIQLRRMNRKKFAQEVRLFLDIYNQSMQGTWGFVPLSEREVEHMGQSLKHLIVPEMTTIAEIDGKVVGAVFALLDFNPRIKQIDGKLFPFGFLRLLWNRKGLKRIRLISTNVVPEYQKWGVGLVVAGRLLPEAQAWGVKEAEFSWVAESNSLSYKTLKRGGAQITKTYRLYDLELSPPPAP
jgi:GNAT superfamily N-acetyltransferase